MRVMRVLGLFGPVDRCGSILEGAQVCLLVPLRFMKMEFVMGVVSISCSICKEDASCTVVWCFFHTLVSRKGLVITHY